MIVRVSAIEAEGTAGSGFPCASCAVVYAERVAYPFDVAGLSKWSQSPQDAVTRVSTREKAL